MIELDAATKAKMEALKAKYRARSAEWYGGREVPEAIDQAAQIVAEAFKNVDPVLVGGHIAEHHSSVALGSTATDAAQGAGIGGVTLPLNEAVIERVASAMFAVDRPNDQWERHQGDARRRYIAMADQAAQIVAEGMRKEQRKLYDLLAVVNRDGGHHREAVGTKRAVEDAIQTWAATQRIIEEAKEWRAVSLAKGYPASFAAECKLHDALAALDSLATAEKGSAP